MSKFITVSIDQAYNTYTGIYSTGEVVLNIDHIVSIQDASYENAVSEPLYLKKWKDGKDCYEISVPIKYETVHQCTVILKGYSYTIRKSIAEITAMIQNVE